MKKNMMIAALAVSCGAAFAGPVEVVSFGYTASEIAAEISAASGGSVSVDGGTGETNGAFDAFSGSGVTATGFTTASNLASSAFTRFGALDTNAKDCVRTFTGPTSTTTTVMSDMSYALMTDAAAAINAAIADGGKGVGDSFYSLGSDSGAAVFDLGALGGTGAAVIELTFTPGSPSEAAEFFVSNDGFNWLFAGDLDNDVPYASEQTLAFGGTFRYLLAVDMSNPSSGANQDGFDINSITVAVPTPAPVALGGAGLLGLVGTRRRRSV